MAVKGSKLARGARGVQFASGFLSSGIMFAKNFDNAAQVGRGIFDKYAVRREPFSKNTVKELLALNLALAGWEYNM